MLTTVQQCGSFRTLFFSDSGKFLNVFFSVANLFNSPRTKNSADYGGLWITLYVPLPRMPRYASRYIRIARAICTGGPGQ